MRRSHLKPSIRYGLLMYRCVPTDKQAEGGQEAASGHVSTLTPLACVAAPYHLHDTRVAGGQVVEALSQRDTPALRRGLRLDDVRGRAPTGPWGGRRAGAAAALPIAQKTVQLCPLPDARADRQTSGLSGRWVGPHTHTGSRRLLAAYLGRL